MESLFVRVLTLSLTGSAVLLPLLLLAPRLRGRYAAGTLSVLWLVLALRMALPVPLSLPWTAVTVDNSLSAQFEHTVLVTEEGYEILTDRTKV